MGWGGGVKTEERRKGEGAKLAESIVNYKSNRSDERSCRENGTNISAAWFYSFPESLPFHILKNSPSLHFSIVLYSTPAPYAPIFEKCS